jgi:hypothetical protein
MRAYPQTISVILEYVTFVNWIMLCFYTWEISRTLACIIAQKNPTWHFCQPVVSGRRNYTLLYWAFFFTPAFCILLARICDFSLVPSSGRVFMILNVLKIWYPLDDLGTALDKAFAFLRYISNNYLELLVETPLALVCRKMNTVFALDKKEASLLPAPRRIILPPELLHLVSLYFSINEVKDLRLISRSWGHAAAPRIFYHLHFKTSKMLNRFLARRYSIEYHGKHVRQFTTMPGVTTYQNDEDFLELIKMMPLMKCLELKAFNLGSKTLTELTRTVPDLEYLNLTNNIEMDFRISSDALRYPRLITLDLSKNFLSDALLHTVCSSHLAVLCLSHCVGVNLDLILESGVMKTLHVLDLSHCIIPIDQLTNLVKLATTLDEKNRATPLRIINLSHASNVAAAINAVGNPTSATVLTIIKPIPDDSPACFNRKSISLDLSFTDLTDRNAIILCNRFRNNIRCLNLRGNKRLTEEGLLAVLRITRLTHLDMSDCTQAGRSPAFAYASLPVFPPAIAFSGRYRGKESLLKVRSYLEAQLM